MKEYIFTNFHLVFLVFAVFSPVFIIYILKKRSDSMLMKQINFIHSRGYTLINSDLELLTQLSLIQKFRKMTSASWRCETEGIEDIKVFKNKSKGYGFTMYIDGEPMTIFTHSYTTGSGKNSSTIKLKVAKLKRRGLVPFHLEQENFSHKFVKFFVKTFLSEDIDFPDRPNFSKMYFLKGSNKEEIRNYFKGKRLSFLESKQMNGVLTANSNYLVYYEHGRMSDEKDHDEFIVKARAIFEGMAE